MELSMARKAYTTPADVDEVHNDASMDFCVYACAYVPAGDPWVATLIDSVYGWFYKIDIVRGGHEGWLIAGIVGFGDI
jgi:hypothetical protein